MLRRRRSKNCINSPQFVDGKSPRRQYCLNSVYLPHAKARLPAQKTKTHTKTRIPGADADARRPQCTQAPPFSRPTPREYLRHMLSSQHRLPKEEISRVLRRGTHVRSDLMELVYKKTTSVPSFSFIVSTKIDKRATRRNRMRRTMSESVRNLLATIPLIDGIFIAKKNFASFTQIEVEKIIVQLLTNVRFSNHEL